MTIRNEIAITMSKIVQNAALGSLNKVGLYKASFPLESLGCGLRSLHPRARLPDNKKQLTSLLDRAHLLNDQI